MQRVALRGIVAVGGTALLLLPTSALSQVALEETDLVQALTTGRSTVYDGKRYLWKDGETWVEIGGELRLERGVDQVVEHRIAPMASTVVGFEGPKVASASQAVVDAVAAALSHLPQVSVSVYVFVEDEADDETRLRREAERIRSLSQELVARGIAADRISPDEDPPTDGEGNVSIVVRAP